MPWWAGFAALVALPAVWLAIFLWYACAVVRDLVEARGSPPDGADTSP
jgi:hypothetical protein